MFLRWLVRGLVACCLCSSLGVSQNPPVQHWEGSIRAGARASFFQMTFTTPSAGIYEMLGQKIPFDVVSRDGNRIEIRTRESKPATFRGERHADRIAGEVVDSETAAQFWMELEPPLPPAKDRDEAWEQDLAYAARKLSQLDLSFAPAARTQYLKQIAELETHVQKLDDAHLMVGLAKAVALADNAHTRLYLVRTRTVVRQYPIRVWWFRNELRVIRATPEHSDLLGCEVSKIGTHSAADALERVTPLYSGSKTWAQYMSTYTLTGAEILRGLDLIPDMNHARWTFRCANGTRSVDFEPTPLRKQDRTVEAWPNLAPRSFEPEPGLVGLQFSSVPLYLSHLEKNYWFEVQGDSGLLYFQFNRCAGQADEKISEFGERLESAWRDPKVHTLVVDLRFNTGGNLDLAKDLMAHLQQEAAGRPVYVIIGRATFSAGLYHAAQWKQWGKATFIGEPAGDRLDFWSEGGNVNLPNSQIAVHFADSFHSYSRKEYPDRKPYFEDLSIDSLAPDYSVSPSFADYAAGRDPAMDMVLRGHTKGAKILIRQSLSWPECSFGTQTVAANKRRTLL
jgi:hypothetical protein